MKKLLLILLLPMALLGMYEPVDPSTIHDPCEDSMTWQAASLVGDRIKNSFGSIAAVTGTIGVTGCLILAKETYGWAGDVKKAYDNKVSLTKEKAKATDAYIAYQDEKSRLFREEQERELRAEWAAEEKSKNERGYVGSFLSHFGF